MVVRAVIEGSSPGKIWVDDPLDPQCGFMATREGWFLAGDPSVKKFNQGLRNLVHDMIIKQDFYSPIDPKFISYLFFHIDIDSWKSKFPEIFDIRFPPLPTHRVHLVCNEVSLDWKNNIPEGFRLLHIDSTLDIESLDIPKDIEDWMEYRLDYEITLGFGMCLVHENKIVVWVNADCTSGKECELGIFTTRDYRLKGLGALTAAATVEHCFSLGYSAVGWHCEDHNYGSLGVAHKVGFIKERDYVHYICMFSEAEHVAEKAMRHFYAQEYGEAIADFERAFRIGEVPTWSYILAARAYATNKEVGTVIKYLNKAIDVGWENWNHVINSDELALIQDNEDFKDFIRLLNK